MKIMTSTTKFQSTPSVWRETMRGVEDGGAPQFQSTPSVWRETHVPPTVRETSKYFNPLPPCGGRRFFRFPLSTSQYFNPLPPCGGRRFPFGSRSFRKTFQSTPSVWRETITRDHVQVVCLHFNPLPPCGGRHFTPDLIITNKVFQSTPSVWRETVTGFL